MESAEARLRFAHAAEQVERLQKQLTEYQSALEAISETSSSAGEVAEASRDLAISYLELKDKQAELLETAEELRQQLLSLQAQVEQTREELSTTSNELSTTVRQSLGQQVNALQGTLGKVVTDYRREFGSHLSQIRLLTVVAVGLLAFMLAVLLFSNRSGDAESLTSLVAIQEAQVQVLNGVGESGLAGQTGDFLRSQGVNVVKVGDTQAATFLRTEIYVHSNAVEAARAVAARLGVPEARVYPGPPTPGTGDITVVIGADYPSLAPF